jgi:hypothetical protein
MHVPPSSEPLTIRGTFHLTDHNGRDVDAESFRGSFVLVFFGFTHCRVVCPRALTRLSPRWMHSAKPLWVAKYKSGGDRSLKQTAATRRHSAGASRKGKIGTRQLRPHSWMER